MVTVTTSTLPLMITTRKLCNMSSVSTGDDLGIRPLDARSLVLSVLLGLPSRR